jgi:hypothetical protein
LRRRIDNSRFSPYGLKVCAEQFKIADIALPAPGDQQPVFINGKIV